MSIQHPPSWAAGPLPTLSNLKSISGDAKQALTLTPGSYPGGSAAVWGSLLPRMTPSLQMAQEALERLCVFGDPYCRHLVDDAGLRLQMHARSIAGWLVVYGREPVVEGPAVAASSLEMPYMPILERHEFDGSAWIFAACCTVYAPATSSTAAHGLAAALFLHLPPVPLVALRTAAIMVASQLRRVCRIDQILCMNSKIPLLDPAPCARTAREPGRLAQERAGRSVMASGGQ